MYNSDNSLETVSSSSSNGPITNNWGIPPPKPPGGSNEPTVPKPPGASGGRG